MWIEVDVCTDTKGIEPLTGCLMNLGINGFQVKDSQDFENFLSDKSINWDYIDDDLMGLKNCETTVTVYIEDNAGAKEQIESIRSELKRLKSLDENNEYGRLELELKNVREEDWANNWKKYFKPIEIGEKLIVKPSWEKVSPDEKRKILEIDPAASFGTGQHNTTRLCLELLEEYLHKGDRILDLGCGSGILSIGGIILGAESATAVDIDPHAAEIAAENAGKNSIEASRYTTYAGDITTDENLVKKIGSGYDVVCANIVADVLVAMSGLFGGFLKEKGILVVSGIIDNRREEVLETIKSSGFELVKTKQSEDWNAAVFVKK